VIESLNSASQESSEQAILSARAGCPDALGRLLDGCRQYLQLIAAQELPRLLQPKVGASDLVQETFLDAQRDFPQFAGRTEGELMGWLRQILLHNICDTSRKFQQVLKRQAARELPWPPGVLETTLASGKRPLQTPSWAACRGEQDDALYEALGRLTADHRQVLVLRNIELRSFALIGSIMNRSPDAVRKLWVRALLALQAEMRDCDVL
jgi:RNA polymerase sigma-70 factor (ECF subfamily)